MASEDLRDYLEGAGQRRVREQDARKEELAARHEARRLDFETGRNRSTFLRCKVLEQATTDLAEAGAHSPPSPKASSPSQPPLRSSDDGHDQSPSQTRLRITRKREWSLRFAKYSRGVRGAKYFASSLLNRRPNHQILFAWATRLRDTEG